MKTRLRTGTSYIVPLGYEFATHIPFLIYLYNMKKVIKMTEDQLKDIVFKVVKEQNVPIGDPSLKGQMKPTNPNEKIPYKPGKGWWTGTSLEKFVNTYTKNPKTYQSFIYGTVGNVDWNFKSDGSFFTTKLDDIVPIEKGIWKDVGGTIVITLNNKKYDSKTNKWSSSQQNCAPQLVDVTKGKILKFGCKTQGVKELQTLLDIMPPTGYFGNKTLGLVKKVQQENNIKVDGIVGPETYKVLTEKALSVPQNVNEYDEDYEDDDISILDKLFKTEDDYDGEPYRGDEEGFSNKMRQNQINKEIRLGDTNIGGGHYIRDRKKDRENEKRRYAGLEPLRNDIQPEPYSPIKSDDLPLDKYLEKKKMRELDEEDDFSILDNLFDRDETPSMETNEQGGTQPTNLTVPEQTLLGFLNKFLKGEEGEFENTPIEQLKKNMMFNSKTIYPMVQKLLEKKRTGKKTYDDKTFNALFLSMDKAITKEQRYEFFKDAANLTNITYNSEY